MQINKILTRRPSAGTAEDMEPMELERAWDKVWDMAWNRKVDTAADMVSHKAVDSRTLADKADTVVATADRVWDRKWDKWRWDNMSV